jgi:glutamate synthase domain-containing protein 2
LMDALVVEEKQWRVLNYVITLRAALASLTAATGQASPTELSRKHAVYRDSYGRLHGADELFPYPDARA